MVPGTSPALRRGNLHDVAVPDAGERFVEIARVGDTRVEHIASSDTPSSEAYDQDHDELVVLLSGTAVLEVAGERAALVAGDWLVLPAGVVHRVIETSSGARWLAVHGG